MHDLRFADVDERNFVRELCNSVTVLIFLSFLTFLLHRTITT